MNPQETFTIKQGIRMTAYVSNNEYLLLMGIDTLQTNQGKEWYEALERMTPNQFLTYLAQLVHSNQFSYKATEKMLKRLEMRGLLVFEPLKVQVTDKWRDIVDEYGGYFSEPNQQN
jgi:hypothetical protein